VNGLRAGNATNRASRPSSVDSFRARATTILASVAGAARWRCLVLFALEKLERRGGSQGTEGRIVLEVSSRMNRQVVLIMLVSASFASADVIVQNLAGTSVCGLTVCANFFGQSFTTPTGGPWDELTFNFYSDFPAVTPLAAGTAFLLTEQYLGTPSALSTHTSGFLAESTGISGGRYTFSPRLEVLPRTTYWVYENEGFGPSGGTTVPGEIAYSAGSANADFAADPIHLVSNFTLEGTPVPEPSTLLFVASALLVLAASTWVHLLPRGFMQGSSLAGDLQTAR
jgi:hypothetical protein